MTRLVHIFFDFEGRISPASYWFASIPIMLIVIFAGCNDEHGWAGFLLVAMIWPSLAVSTKRWHDRDKSGWWNLINLVPVVGPIWSLIECGFLPGTDEENRFG
jgi:uncharacterized membrane protein YhaH (DUF805 family)